MLPRVLLTIQDMLKEQHSDGYLLFDGNKGNTIARKLIGDSLPFVSRRWCYWIPVEGDPLLVIHVIDIPHFPDLPGRRVSYIKWQEFSRIMQEFISNKRTITLEYSPYAALPHISLVDGGTIELLRSFGVTLVSSADIIQACICRWNESQLSSHIRAAQSLFKIVHQTFDMIKQRCNKGCPLSEIEIQNYLITAMESASLEFSAPPIVAVGSNSGNPHYAPSKEHCSSIQTGLPLLIDIWAKEKIPHAVYADITWVAFVGSPVPSLYEEIFSIVRSARDLAVTFIDQRYKDSLPVCGWEVDEVVRTFISSHGYGDFFIHRTGHNIGTQVHGEGANLDDLETHDERRLIPGLGFSIEPGIYLPEFGIRSEINVYLSEKGPEIYTSPQTQLIRL